MREHRRIPGNSASDWGAPPGTCRSPRVSSSDANAPCARHQQGGAVEVELRVACQATRLPRFPGLDRTTMHLPDSPAVSVALRRGGVGRSGSIAMASPAGSSVRAVSRPATRACDAICSTARNTSHRCGSLRPRLAARMLVLALVLPAPRLAALALAWFSPPRPPAPPRPVRRAGGAAVGSGQSAAVELGGARRPAWSSGGGQMKLPRLVVTLRWKFLGQALSQRPRNATQPPTVNSVRRRVASASTELRRVPRPLAPYPSWSQRSGLSVPSTRRPVPGARRRPGGRARRVRSARARYSTRDASPRSRPARRSPICSDDRRATQARSPPRARAAASTSLVVSRTRPASPTCRRTAARPCDSSSAARRRERSARQIDGDGCVAASLAAILAPSDDNSCAPPPS